MENQDAGRDLDTLLINLDKVPFDRVLARQDTALAQAIARIVRSGDTDDDRLTVAGFSNFV